MFIAALLTIARQISNLNVHNRGVDKLYVIYVCVYIYTHAMDYYSTIKRNRIVLFAEIWMDLETGIQS